MTDYDDISPELKEKALQCKTSDELFALAKSEGIEMDEEMLDTISGGSWTCSGFTCEDF